jgi:hypothetical protein
LLLKARDMPVRKYPVLIESHRDRAPSGLSASSSAQPFEVSLALREKGWRAYRVEFDASAAAWIAKIIDWGVAA